jgi:hypothetical protein
VIGHRKAIRHHHVMKRLALMASVVLASACSSGTPAPSASVQRSQGPSLVVASPAPTSFSPTPAPYPSLPHGTTLIPSISPLTQYASTVLTLAVDDHIGQPAESIVWTTKPYQPDAGYAGRVASALGLQGPGTVGDAPGGSAPWRLWLGPKVLAVNERTGDVLFFDPTADDGPRPDGAAQHDPALDFARTLASLGMTIDTTSTPGSNPVFRGTDAISIAVPAMDGSWLGPGNRDGVALFADAPNPYDAVHYPGTVIYDTDELGLLTSKGRPVEIVHHPFGTLSGGTIYPITTYRDAANALRANPKAYLRLLSAPPGEPVTLHVIPDGARIGSAWASGSPGNLTRASGRLVPVWEFLAEGTSASGKPASAMFTVDAVLPEFRTPVASAPPAVDADALLRTQLSVSVGGHQPDRMSASATAQAELITRGFPSTVQPSIVMVDADHAEVSATDGQRTIRLTLRHAFPGLTNSIWYVQ